MANAQQMAQLLSMITGRNIRPVQTQPFTAQQLGGVDMGQLQNAIQGSGMADRLGGLLESSSNGSSSNSELRSLVRKNADAIDSLRQTLEREIGGSGASITSPNYRRGIGGGIHHSSPGSGGVNASEIFTIPSSGGVAEDQKETISWDGVPLDRLRNNVLCKFEAVTGPDTLSNAEFITLDMFWNTDSVPDVQNIPLSYVTPTLEGQRQYWEVGKYVPTNVTPSIRVTFGEAFTPSANEPLFFRAVSAEDC